ncbi:hypothetical protein CFBP498_48000 (plasmid) [Xanthomonas hortorum pv. vitians]|uniref:Nucleotidyltransferase n=1 Tax=Xanthomonas hortorum pv. vitians TaxID=83224 RepID=A0A6V7FH60_9XANT|nr:nucleotidyltransferase [Xanthomonas hortorum]NMI31466.1 nucleotidyltransferase [Xanthomonas hortorum pv. vitians]CAD0362992.1 hypothetical protein CFBP498_48000 [Xanthomonas hortorum pv. vitians]CAD0362994.1 hypothetical protein CFBP498_48000 [Xanthomonas hortorum pv. vitians]
MSLEVTSHRSAIRRLVASHGATNPRLVGAGSPNVDASILVDLKPGTSDADMTRLHAELEKLLRGRIDLLTPRDVPARQRATLLQGVQVI